MKEIEEIFYYDIYSYKIINDTATIKGESENNLRIKELILPETIDNYKVTGIEDNAFAYYVNLTTIEIPDSVAFIGCGAFNTCISLNNIKFNNDHPVYCITNNIIFNKVEKTIHTYLASNKQEKYIIPQGIVAIEKDAFSGCSNLINIEIPNSVTSIGESAFFDCINLNNIEISASIISIGARAFGFCENLNDIRISKNNTVYTLSDNVLFDLKEKKIHTCFPTIKSQTYVIPHNIKTVGAWSFWNCTNLKKIEMTDSITSIGEYAFSDCSDLNSIKMSHSITSIGNHAFYHCSQLTDILIPDSVNYIGEGSFLGCYSLTNIKIPKSVTIIDDQVFHGCSKISNIEIHNSITSIGKFAFFCCYRLQNIEIPDSVTCIGEQAFSGCTGLTSIKVPDSVTTIGKHAFCISDDFILEVNENSYAHSYAINNNIPYTFVNNT